MRGASYSPSHHPGYSLRDAILRLLRRDELQCWQLAERLGTSPRSMSSTLSRMRRAGVVECVEIDGAGKRWRVPHERCRLTGGE